LSHGPAKTPAWNSYPPRTFNIHTLDGFDYLANTERRYDVIYMDAFLKPESSDTSATPVELRTLEFFRSMQSKLKPNGSVVFNLTVQSDTENDVQTIRKAFEQTVVYRAASRNLVVVGRTNADPLSEEILSMRAQELDRRFDARFSFRKILASRRD